MMWASSSTPAVISPFQGSPEVCFPSSFSKKPFLIFVVPRACAVADSGLGICSLSCPGAAGEAERIILGLILSLSVAGMIAYLAFLYPSGSCFGTCSKYIPLRLETAQQVQRQGKEAGKRDKVGGNDSVSVLSGILFFWKQG